MEPHSARNCSKAVPTCAARWLLLDEQTSRSCKEEKVILQSTMETVRSLVSTMRSPLGRQTTEGGHRAVAAAGRRPMRRGMAVVVTVCAVHSLSSRAFRPLLAAAAAQADGDFGMCASRGSQLCAGAARSATSSVPDVEKTSLWKDVEVETPEALQAVVDNLLGSGKNRVVRRTKRGTSTFLSSVTPAASDLLTLTSVVSMHRHVAAHQVLGPMVPCMPESRP